MSPWRRSIRGRVLAVILVTSVIVLLVTASAFVAYEVFSFRSQLIRNSQTLGAVISDNSAVPLSFGTTNTANDILAALRAEPDITAAVLYDQAQKIFAKYPSDIRAEDTPPLIEGAGHRFDSSGLLIYQPVLLEGKPVGYLTLRASLRGMNERLSRYALIATGVLAGSLIVAFFISNLLQRRITNPILALTEGAEQIASRADFSIRVPRQTDDELGRLTESFNSMIAEIDRNQKKVFEQARLIDLSHDAIIVRDSEGRITFWSRGAADLYGYDASEVLGKHLKLLLKTEYPAPLEQITGEMKRLGRWSGELRHTRKDGSVLYVASRWSVLTNPDGTQKAVLESNTDVTEKRAFQENLERLVAERTMKLQEMVVELEAFSYSISHDMRSPLRAMQGYSRVLLADYKDKLDADATHYLDRIFRASSRLDMLIQDVLAYSKVAKGEISLTPIDLERLLADLLPTRPELQEAKAEIDIVRPLHPVIGHEAYLTQCITNLLGNAVKFVTPGAQPRVTIRTEREETKVRLWIEDNGIGIDPTHQQRIFEIFGRVYPEKQYSGTGIGLAIVRKAVQRMNGEIGVVSELGKGSRFWITLAAAES